jgi:hypothetical protein
MTATTSGLLRLSSGNRGRPRKPRRPGQGQAGRSAPCVARVAAAFGRSSPRRSRAPGRGTKTSQFTNRQRSGRTAPLGLPAARAVATTLRPESATLQKRTDPVAAAEPISRDRSPAIGAAVRRGAGLTLTGGGLLARRAARPWTSTWWPRGPARPPGSDCQAIAGHVPIVGHLSGSLSTVLLLLSRGSNGEALERVERTPPVNQRFGPVGSSRVNLIN